MSAGSGDQAASVALVGTGYIGGSLLLALRRAGLLQRSVGWDRDPDAARRAQARGIIDDIAGSASDAVRGADVVVIGTPVGAIGEIAAEIAPAIGGDTLVFDLGSTKADVVAAVEGALRDPGCFVGAHPIAGREHRGPDAADAELFAGRPCLLTPTVRTRRAMIEKCARLWTAAGARVVEMDPALHDRVLGLVSHLPHAAAFALGLTVDAVLAGSPDVAARVPGLWGGGFADTTRIAASSPTMWRDIFLANRDVLLPMCETLAQEVGALARAIADNDGDAIVKLIERAGAARRRVMGDAR